jgi:hypothetical protein
VGRETDSTSKAALPGSRPAGSPFRSPDGKCRDSYFPFPNLSAGSFALPHYLGTYGDPNKYNRGYEEAWDIFVQHEFGKDFNAQVGYISNLVDSFENRYNLPLVSNGRLRGGYLPCRRFKAPSSDSAVWPGAGHVSASHSLLRW